MKSHKAAVKEDYNQKTMDARVEWCIIQLQIRPHAVDWRMVIWCDELHWKLGLKYVKNIKRFPTTRFREDNT